MKIKSTVKHLEILLLVAVGAQSADARSETRWNAPAIVTKNCSGCHGIDGNSQLSYVPRLAGVDAVYLNKKMSEFQAAAPPPVEELFSRITTVISRKTKAMSAGASSNEARINMIGIARDLTAEETKGAVTWYASQKPESGRSGNAQLIQKGRALFLNGQSAEGIMPCQGCHGAGGEGKAQAPRIAGQNATYLMGELEKFKTGDRKHAPEMTLVAAKVDPDEFRALVAYIRSL